MHSADGRAALGVQCEGYSCTLAVYRSSSLGISDDTVMVSDGLVPRECVYFIS